MNENNLNENEIVEWDSPDDLLTMPAVALRGLTLMPEMIIHFDISRKQRV